MADTNMDDLAQQLQQTHVKATSQNEHDSQYPAAAEQKKRQHRTDNEETWSKRHHALVQSTLTPITLAEKYSSWASAQGYELLERPLPLADVEELSAFMCTTIMQITHEKSEEWKDGRGFPFWRRDGEDGGANDVIRKWYKDVGRREERIQEGGLPKAARDLHLYTADEEVVKFNRRLTGLPPEEMPEALQRGRKKHGGRTSMKGSDEWDRPRSPPRYRSRHNSNTTHDSEDNPHPRIQPQDRRARCGSDDRGQVQYRSRRDSIETVVDFGGRNRFGLVSKSKKYHVAKPADYDDDDDDGRSV